MAESKNICNPKKGMCIGLRSKKGDVVIRLHLSSRDEFYCDFDNGLFLVSSCDFTLFLSYEKFVANFTTSKEIMEKAKRYKTNFATQFIADVNSDIDKIKEKDFEKLIDEEMKKTKDKEENKETQITKEKPKEITKKENKEKKTKKKPLVKKEKPEDSPMMKITEVKEKKKKDNKKDNNKITKSKKKEKTTSVNIAEIEINGMKNSGRGWSKYFKKNKSFISDMIRRHGLEETIAYIKENMKK